MKDKLIDEFAAGSLGNVESIKLLFKQASLYNKLQEQVY